METFIVVLIGLIINFLVLVAVVRTAVKQAIAEPTFREQSLMRNQYKQTMLLAAMARKIGVDEHAVSDILNDQGPK